MRIYFEPGKYCVVFSKAHGCFGLEVSIFKIKLLSLKRIALFFFLGGGLKALDLNNHQNFINMGSVRTKFRL